jgi:hypothetical protein
MGGIDRVVRIILAVAVGILYLTGAITGTAAIALGVLALIFLATSAIGFCPLYALLGFTTVKKEVK